ncbi:MAG: S53 family peptidase [Nocardioidaceae bacterium]
MISLSARRRHGRTLPVVVAATTAILTISAGAAAAGTHAATKSDRVTVPQSGTAPLAAGKELGTTADSTPMSVSIILRSPRLRQLESRVAAGWRGRFLSTRQFAWEYGQSPSVVAGIERYLHGFGITTQGYADRLDISASGTVGEFNQAFGVSLRNYRVKEPSASARGHAHYATVHGTLDAPTMPRRYGGAILAIMGLSSYSPFSSQAVASTHHRVNAVKKTSNGIPAGNGLSPEDFVNQYHLAPLEHHGALGQGQTIGIVTLAAIDPATPYAFWNDVLGLNVATNRLTIVPVDGGSPGPSADDGSDETDLDVEQSGAIAPRAKIRLYEAPNTDPGFTDAFFAAASDNIADTISVSWGESETVIRQAIASGTEPAAFGAVYDEVFAEMGAQGQSDFAAAGDSGSYDDVYELGTTELVVDSPAASPYITSAGGTTLPGLQQYGDGNGGTISIDIPSERAWSWDYFFPFWQQFGYSDEASNVADNLGGGGGGYSVMEPRPSYQRHVSAFHDRGYLTPTAFQEIAPGLSEPTSFLFAPTPALGSGYKSRGRAVPDLSTNADPQTGYAVYDPTLFASTGGYAQYGGTSFVAPQLNGATAVINSAVGHRVGFWNPRIYSFADSWHSPFTPLNSTQVYSGVNYLSDTSATGVTTAVPGEFSNNNLYYTGKRGADWNPATGLGVPDLTALAYSFAGHHR